MAGAISGGNQPTDLGTNETFVGLVQTASETTRDVELLAEGLSLCLFSLAR